MKVLMVEKTEIGGVNVVVEHLKKELEKRRIKVDIIRRNEDLKVYSFFKSINVLKKLYKKWSREYDIIHAHDWSIVYPGIKANIKNLVATFHAFPTNLIARYFENYCISQLKERAIVISPKMKLVYKNAAYIPNGVDLNLFKRNKKIKIEENTIGLAQKYNSDKITKIAKKLKFKIKETKGKYKYEELPKFYSSLQIFISIPYKQAGFNLVWLEAMATEVPYIIGTNAGIGNILPIYKINSFKELEELLIMIKEGTIPKLKNLRNWIKKNKLTWEKSAKKLIRLYKTFISY